MAIIVKTSIKSNFETGDKPTQTDFEELIDQSIPNWFEDQNIQVDGGTAGVYEVQSTASATARPVGAVGAQLLSVGTTASAAYNSESPSMTENARAWVQILHWFVRVEEIQDLNKTLRLPLHTTPLFLLHQFSIE